MNKERYAAYVLLKNYVTVLLRVMGSSFIWFLGRSKLSVTLSCPDKFKREQLALQRAFEKLYINYDVCETCFSHCCHSSINRFDFIDCYLNGYNLWQGLSPWHSFSHLILSSNELFRETPRISSMEEQAENCVYHSTSSGCLLPIGSRPGMCISGTCYRLIKRFSVKDLQRYSVLLSKYIKFYLRCHLSLLKEVVSL